MGMTQEAGMGLMEGIKKQIQRELPDSIVEVNDMTGTFDHFQILVASDAFLGKALLEQHQLVMDILREDLRERIHAVKIKTMSKDHYQKLGRN